MSSSDNPIDPDEFGNWGETPYDAESSSGNFKPSYWAKRAEDIRKQLEGTSGPRPFPAPLSGIRQPTLGRSTNREEKVADRLSNYRAELYQRMGADNFRQGTDMLVNVLVEMYARYLLDRLAQNLDI